MVEFKWTKRIKISLSLILMLQLRAIMGLDSFFTVKIGDDVTLPCENKIKDQYNCDSTTWLFANARHSPVVELVEHGQIDENAKSKSARLSVTNNCSLGIRKVTVEDAGLYTCRQFDKSGRQQDLGAQVALFVINIDQHKNDVEVTLTCSVLAYGQCTHTVQWLHQGDEDDFTDLRSTQAICSSTVIFSTSHLDQKLKYDEFFQCNVSDQHSGNQLLCNPTPPSSCEKPATLKENIRSITQTRSLHDSDLTSQEAESQQNTTSVNQTPPASNNRKDTKLPDIFYFWLYITVAVAVAAILLITVGVLIKLRTTKGNNKTQMENDTSLNPAVTQPDPESSRGMTNPEDDVAYVSISFVKTNSKVEDQSKEEEDEGDAVTYSTVKMSSSSAEACTDPSDLYATVSKSKETEAPV